MAKARNSDGRSADRRGTARERLLDAALLVFARSGYHKAGVDEIARKAGVSKGAVYAHFTNKQELFLAAFGERVDPLVGDLMRGCCQQGVSLQAGNRRDRLVRAERHAVLLCFEFWSLAVRDPQVGRCYNAWMDSLIEDLAQVLAANAPGASPQGKARAREILRLTWGRAMDELVGARERTDAHRT